MLFRSTGGSCAFSLAAASGFVFFHCFSQTVRGTDAGISTPSGNRSQYTSQRSLGVKSIASDGTGIGRDISTDSPFACLKDSFHCFLLYLLIYPQPGPAGLEKLFLSVCLQQLYCTVHPILNFLFTPRANELVKNY